MFKKDYFWPGFAAIVLAIAFPIYWVYVSKQTGLSIRDEYYANVLNFDISDWVYLFLGAMEIYIYASFKKVLHDRLNFRSIDSLLLLTICNAAIFHFGLFAVDASLYLVGDQIGQGTRELILKGSWYVSTSCIFVYGLIGSLIGIMLLSQFKSLPNLLKVFAITTLALNLFQLTFILGFVVILLFPLSLAILAMYFLQEPDMIEVV